MNLFSRFLSQDRLSFGKLNILLVILDSIKKESFECLTTHPAFVWSTFPEDKGTDRGVGTVGIIHISREKQTQLFTNQCPERHFPLFLVNSIATGDNSHHSESGVFMHLPDVGCHYRYVVTVWKTLSHT